jgi:hypothetical protein
MSISPTKNLGNNLRIPLPLRLTSSDEIPNDDLTDLRPVPARADSDVREMFISAVLFSRGRWHIGQFFTLLTRSSELEPEPEPEDSLVSAEAPENWRVG